MEANLRDAFLLGKKVGILIDRYNHCTDADMRDDYMKKIENYQQEFEELIRKELTYDPKAVRKDW